MKWNHTKLVIPAAAIALIALFAFQVKWMSDSRSLIEEQFNQKVNMAMCYAVGMMGDDVQTTSCIAPNPVAGCVPAIEGKEAFQLEATETVDLEQIERSVGKALNFYNINLDYEVSVAPKKSWTTSLTPKYTCSLNPMEEQDAQLLIVSFPGKEQYIFSKMKFMFFSSIVILAFISLVFLLASYTLIRQKRMYRINKEFFNNMAHEFRTPLANISLAGKLLAKHSDAPKKERYLGVVKEETKKLTGHVDRILNLAKMENGQYQLDKENLCLKTLIEEVIREMDLPIKEKNAHINFSIGKDLEPFLGDKYHLSNAFRNLLENALKYSGDSPEIDISIQKDREGVLIHFADNGFGIAKKDQAEVFEKYYRVNNGNVHNQKGFGLGLSYVKMIVELHKGFIKIFSDLNKGTRFDLYLPAN